MVQQAALFIMGLKEKFKLTQVAVQGIIEGMTGLVQVGRTTLDVQGLISSQVHLKHLQKTLSNSGVSVDPIFSEDSTHMNPFAGVETHHLQLKFYRKHLDYRV